MADSDILSQNEIDNLLASLTAGLDSSEQNLQQNVASLPMSSYEAPVIEEENHKGYKLYNFRRPDKFSKDHLRAIQDIHKEFSRQFGMILSAYLRMHIDIEVVSVDQLTYDEFVRSMPNPITIGILELNPLPGQILLGMSHEVTSSIVDRMLGGTGVSEIKPRELTDIEEALAKRVFEKIIKTLEDAWKSVFPVHGEVVGMDNSYTMVQIANPGEIVALVTLEVQMSSRYSGLLSLCFPYPVLETVVDQLSSQHIFQAKGIVTTNEEKQQILDKLHNTRIEVKVILGKTSISVQDLADLKTGDVLRLDNSVDENLTVCVNSLPKFLARPGIKKNKVAVNIINVINNSD